MARPTVDSIAIETPIRIVAAAELEFARNGFAAARLADIAEAAGVRRPSLLYHFATKELLHAAVVRGVFARLGAALAAGRDVTGGFVEQLAGMTRAFDRFLDAEPHVARLVIGEILTPSEAGELLAHIAPLLDGIERWIREAGVVRSDVPIRSAILHVASDALLRSAAGPLRSPIWCAPEPDTSWRIARLLLLDKEVS